MRAKLFLTCRNNGNIEFKLLGQLQSQLKSKLHNFNLIFEAHFPTVYQNSYIPYFDRIIDAIIIRMSFKSVFLLVPFQFPVTFFIFAPLIRFHSLKIPKIHVFLYRAFHLACNGTRTLHKFTYDNYGKQ